MWDDYHRQQLAEAEEDADDDWDDDWDAQRRRRRRRVHLQRSISMDGANAYPAYSQRPHLRPVLLCSL